MTVDARYERWQTPESSHPGSSVWREGHRLHLTAPKSSVEVIVQIERLHFSARAHYRSAVIESGRPLVGIVETRIPAPPHGWEIRTSGLWADHICEDPMVHWSYGLEAFAIAVDQASELTESGYGDRVPLGWELEFEAEADAVWAVSPENGNPETGTPETGTPATETGTPATETGTPVTGNPATGSGTESGMDGHYLQAGIGHGLLLDGDGEREIAGAATRHHWWGSDPRTGPQPFDLSVAAAVDAS